MVFSFAVDAACIPFCMSLPFPSGRRQQFCDYVRSHYVFKDDDKLKNPEQRRNRWNRLPLPKLMTHTSEGNILLTAAERRTLEGYIRSGEPYENTIKRLDRSQDCRELFDYLYLWYSATCNSAEFLGIIAMKGFDQLRNHGRIVEMVIFIQANLLCGRLHCISSFPSFGLFTSNGQMFALPILPKSLLTFGSQELIFTALECMDLYNLTARGLLVIDESLGKDVRLTGDVISTLNTANSRVFRFANEVVKAGMQRIDGEGFCEQPFVPLGPLTAFRGLMSLSTEAELNRKLVVASAKHLAHVVTSFDLARKFNSAAAIINEGVKAEKELGSQNSELIKVILSDPHVHAWFTCRTGALPTLNICLGFPNLAIVR